MLFYISLLVKPSSTTILTSPIPWVPGDKVTVVGGSKSGEVVRSQKLKDGSIQLNISLAVVDAGQYAWVFKIKY
jgi:alpha-L-fucosidase